jgi:hypothetical protein
MLQNRFLGSFLADFLGKVTSLAFLSGLAIMDGAALARPIAPQSGVRIVELMQTYGQPDRVAGSSGRNRAYHWRLKTTSAFEGPDHDERLEDFFCDVTAMVGPNGRVISLRAEVGDVGAGAIASSGAFGPLCKHGFGLRPARGKDEGSRTMRR